MFKIENGRIVWKDPERAKEAEDRIQAGKAFASVPDESAEPAASVFIGEQQHRKSRRPSRAARVLAAYCEKVRTANTSNEEKM